MTWYRETTKDSRIFEQLGVFTPYITTTPAATTTPKSGPLLSGRIILTNPTNSSYKITFTSVECEDERLYNCTVIGRTNGVTVSRGGLSNLTVTAKPKTASLVNVELNPASPIEGEPVQLTCTSDVGRPAGMFLWTKYNNATDSVGMAINSTTETSPGTDCTYNGSSVISMVMTRDDIGAIIRCTIRQETVTDPTAPGYYTQTGPINVFYKPEPPTITISPESTAIHYVGTRLTLTCYAVGNPAPTYIWKFKGREIGTTAKLQLSNIYAGQSGDYVCLAANSLTENIYTISTTVKIIIIPLTNGACATVGGGVFELLIKNVLSWYLIYHLSGKVQYFIM
ncbi:carcinoembryonic antigen-related cell adhesion molecule 1-like [Pecten maximus]|uniref:carcinoembryonic antigen-related cell adhesion molecule 1-like n=1 Tax=Pecten maximus TaxID=6579 RepID=UPI00145804D5|nr:carcinoembryonic antigen-related cell adhesion molecule 1-like [Pecten maximus]